MTRSVLSLPKDHPIRRSLSLRRNTPKQSILLIVRTSREIYCVGSATVAAVANAQSPQAVDHDRLSIGITQLVEKFACRAVNIDVAIPKIANQDISGKPTEAGRRHCHAPWRVELAMLRESLQSS